ncbi:terpene synthase family protein [Streptomyces syringium]|uniref:terpene synthase family protein n=1 Tax=Streptomyces syringium TaxID=76729 RepID=UPI003454D02C
MNSRTNEDGESVKDSTTSAEATGATGRDAWVVDLPCPFPALVHPRLDAIESDLRQWLQRWGIYDEHSRRSRWDYLVATMYALGDLERVQVVARIMIWLCQADEACMERPATNGRPQDAALYALCFQEILEDPVPQPHTEDRYILALRDAQLALRQIASPVQIRWFNAGLTRQLLAATAEVVLEATDSVLPVDDYLRLRRFSAATGAAFAIGLEITGGYELPEPVRYTEDYTHLMRLVDELYGFTNDIMTYGRDAAVSRKVIPNVVATLMRERQLPLDRAREAAITMYHERLDAFTTITARMRQDADPATARLVEELGPYIGSQRAFFHRSERYRHTAVFTSDSTEATPTSGPAPGPRAS